ncbi:HpcH/HpaI aldolase/citrate lyase family protein [Actinomadura hibisca]|uniref:HpcH/HpaI aldolase/citrate lyase family protein n=1 Tax=Actinomadura hibisca TaxID=68565 RepID=UPI00082DA048|nr:aldolase/citrate lyase family protein [Actinomadura hibisca]
MGTRAAAQGVTWLITPGSEPGRYPAALTCGPDVALLDLEDSVPAELKQQARTAALDFLIDTTLQTTTQTTVETTVEMPVLGLRINAPGTVCGLRDLLALTDTAARPAVLLIPKVEAARDVDLVADVLGTDRPALWALIESPQAISRLPGILSARALAGVVFGAADYAAAARCRRTDRALLYPRAALAAAAAAAGLPAVDSPYFDLADPGGLRREAQQARDLGFTGKGAVHPKQLPSIQTAFQPSADELDHARAVVRAADTTAGISTDSSGQMVGPPLVAAARALLQQAETTRTPPGAT